MQKRTKWLFLYVDPRAKIAQGSGSWLWCLVVGHSCGLVGKESTCYCRRPPAIQETRGLIAGSRRSLGEGNGNLLRYSCLGNPMDRGSWLSLGLIGALQRGILSPVVGMNWRWWRVRAWGSESGALCSNPSFSIHWLSLGCIVQPFQENVSIYHTGLNIEYQVTMLANNKSLIC